METVCEADERFMAMALELAAWAAEQGEVPIGAVAVLHGQVIGRGYNRREMDKNPLAHAELLALREAASHLGAWRLLGVQLFVTLEPCSMCAGALVQARISRLVFGARDAKAGAVGSLYHLLEDSRHNHRVEVVSGVQEAACAEALKCFFSALRQNKA
ncbi:MAG: tRNA adenosine(34) deaminase TadA [Proteobacteria bacterium]|nr:tRNA adenosine(34) deaminase TadA [Cystobacterineae bacterium]MCL2314864.1 tRNA adenosine(34) deaminase TadA [Pseudomonadota bacterium]